MLKKLRLRAVRKGHSFDVICIRAVAFAEIPRNKHTPNGHDDKIKTPLALSCLSIHKSEPLSFNISSKQFFKFVF